MCRFSAHPAALLLAAGHQAEGTEAETSVRLSAETPTTRGSLTSSGTVAGSDGASIFSVGRVVADPESATSVGAYERARELLRLERQAGPAPPASCLSTAHLTVPPRAPTRAGSTSGEFQGEGGFEGETTTEATGPSGTATASSRDRVASLQSGLAGWGHKRDGAFHPLLRSAAPCKLHLRTALNSVPSTR